MRRRWRPLQGNALLVLFTGTMLPGQALHLCAPDTCHPTSAAHEHHVARELPTDGSPILADSEVPCHDADGCLICQFYSQGQLAAPAGAAETARPLVATVPVMGRAAPVLPLAGLHNPRGPPPA